MSYYYEFSNAPHAEELIANILKIFKVLRLYRHDIRCEPGYRRTIHIEPYIDSTSYTTNINGIKLYNRDVCVSNKPICIVEGINNDTVQLDIFYNDFRDTKNANSYIWYCLVVKYPFSKVTAKLEHLGLVHYIPEFIPSTHRNYAELIDSTCSKMDFHRAILASRGIIELYTDSGVLTLVPRSGNTVFGKMADESPYEYTEEFSMDIYSGNKLICSNAVINFGEVSMLFGRSISVYDTDHGMRTDDEIGYFLTRCSYEDIANIYEVGKLLGFRCYESPDADLTWINNTNIVDYVKTLQVTVESDLNKIPQSLIKNKCNI